MLKTQNKFWMNDDGSRLQVWSCCPVEVSDSDVWSWLRRNELPWRRRQPARQRSEQLLPAPITVTSTAISSARLLQRTRRTRWRPTKLTAWVSVESMGWILQRVPFFQSTLCCVCVCVCPLCCLSLWLISVSPSVPVANKRDTRSIEEAMNEMRAKKRQKKEEVDTGASSTS